MTVEDSLHVFELIEARPKTTSTIFCSHFAPEGWYEKIQNLIVHDSYQIMLNGDVSMHERHGLAREHETNSIKTEITLL